MPTFAPSPGPEPRDAPSPRHPAGPAARQTSARWWLILAVITAIAGGLLWSSERGRTFTTDEKLHLLRGMAYWDAEDLRLNYAHPPLANAVDTIALRGELNALDPPLEERRAWDRAYVTGLANGLMSREGNAMDLSLIHI